MQKSKVYLALYKGPSSGFPDKLTHAAICWFTKSIYSHCELVVDGVCYSASVRDGGVRSKVINLDSGKWDLVELEGYDPNVITNWFSLYEGQKYDWAGIFRFILPFLPANPLQWFCSEAVGAALGIENPEEYSPGDLLALLQVRNRK